MARRRKIQRRKFTPPSNGFTKRDDFAYLEPRKPDTTPVKDYALSRAHSHLDFIPSREPRVNYGDFASKSPSSSASDPKLRAPHASYINTARLPIPGSRLPNITAPSPKWVAPAIPPSPHQIETLLRKLERKLALV